MQGQRSSIESLPETFEFDHGSGSRNSGIEQQVYWNNMLLDPMETQTFPGYVMPPGDMNMPYVNVAGQASSSLDIWNSAGPSTSGHSQNHSSHDVTKMDHGWASSLTITSGGGPRVEERRHEAASMLSLGNMNINLNTNNISQSSDHNSAHVGISNQVAEAGLYLHPHNPGLFESEHVPSLDNSTNICGNSSGNVGFFPEDGDGRPGGSLDGRRLSCKRKNIEGASGQSSASGSAISFHQSENSSLHSISARHCATTSMDVSQSSDYLLGLGFPEVQSNPGFGTVLRGANSDCHLPANIAGNAESSQRNFRMRIDPTHQHDTPPPPPPHPWGPGNSSAHSAVWPPHQQYSAFVPFDQLQETRPMVASASSHSRPHFPIIPGLPQNGPPLAWNGAFSLRVGSSSSSPVLPGESSTVSREEVNSRSMLMNNISEHAMFIPPADARQPVQDPRNWSLVNESINMPGNAAPPSRVGTSSGFHPSVTTTWVPHQNHLTRHHQRLSEVVRRSLFPSGNSEFGGQTSNLPLQNSGNSSTSSEIGHQPGTGFRVPQQSVVRSAVTTDRQNDGVQGVPLSLRTLVAAREGRRRMLSEHIRNALSLMRRGENLRLEDVFVFDRSMFYGAADLHDRHRDMRLDVDNMSYEELLALEERIGNVSTGLSEETIIKHLKQRKYSCHTEEATGEAEPCCICQEEYVDGEDVGTLNCGHDFHTACIKQWLMHKNLCPICKETGLVTREI